MSTPLERDGKIVKLRTWSEALVPFLGTSLVVAPLWLAVLLPLSAISLGLKSVLKKPVPHKLVSLENVKVLKKASDQTGRDFDLVLFGATGFTGRLSALYLAKQYAGSSLRWALAGRRRDALTAIRDELVAINPALKDLPIIIADANDNTSIDNMVKQTKVVITTSGPFARYGKYLVQSCAGSTFSMKSFRICIYDVFSNYKCTGHIIVI